MVPAFDLLQTHTHTPTHADINTHAHKRVVTSDDELAEVGDGGPARRQRDAAVQVLLPPLGLHLEGGRHPLVAEP